MAWVKWFSHLLNEEGQPIPGADISIYLAGTEDGAIISKDRNGSNKISDVPQLKTNEDGYFEFWIGNDHEVDGYLSFQKFKIGWNKEGISEGYNDYISILPNFIEVDLSKDDDNREKTVSNWLAKNWEDHRRNRTPHKVHGIEKVDETSTDTEKNRLVSNNLSKQWEDHKDSTYNESPHGIEKVDETDTDDTKNKLVSNNLMHSVTTHGNLTYNESPHGIEKVDETDTDDTKNKLVSNYQLYSIWWKLGSYLEEFSSASLSPSGNDYYVSVEHSLEEEWPVVDVYNTSERKQIVPKDIESISSNEILIWLNSAIDISVKVKK